MRLWKYFPHHIVWVYRRIFMEGEEINPRYEVSCESGVFGINGTELTTGDAVSVGRVSKNREFAEELAALLNDKKVSVHHAKDVIRDMLLEFLEG